ncbi:uncharacterized protein isoform X2 [Rhodnius prolixus]|uniref:uncharacterized protein isoform X2 n=1 Tax=Rhodnius prolixus TaxID=13249 RepID=UPI003D18BB19
MLRFIASVLIFSFLFIGATFTFAAEIPSQAPVVTSTSEPSTSVQPITTVSPNVSTVAPTTTVAPNTTTTTTTTVAPKPSPTTPNTTTTVTPATTAKTSTVPTTVSTTIYTSTLEPIHTTMKPDYPSDRKFDAFSFLGGFSLGLGLVAIGFLSWKFYMSRQENVYHTL